MAVPETPTPVTPAPAVDVADASTAHRRRRVGEIWIVLGMSLGQSAVYAVISLVAKLTAGPPLKSQSTALNVSVSPRPLLDLTYQLTG
ncbi:MAG: CPBP family intramembrane metalloprotease domain-containing protein, partial [Cellulomonas sp.]|nr:CPBP family intramembrane metalloprotease domain-containing protein [Cellulomonas sp.]